MRFQKLISTILHPIVIPTIGLLFYFILIPSYIRKQQQILILSLVFIITYVFPLLLMIVLKSLGVIKNLQVSSIQERKIPMFAMMIIFYALGSIFINGIATYDIGMLFYATCLGLAIIYLLFAIKIKTSLHLLSLGIAIGFFLLMSNRYGISILPFLIILFILSGFLASSRLYLKAHTPKEVYLGFFIGTLCPFIVFYLYRM